MHFTRERRLATLLIVGLSVLSGYHRPLLVSPPAGRDAAPSPTRERMVEGYGRLPLSFSPNRGQTDSRVRYLSRGQGYTLFLTPDEVVFSLRQPSPGTTPADGGSSGVLRLRPVGAASEVSVSAEEALPGRANYLLGNDPAQWHPDVPLFSRVRYTGVYPGIDLVYYGNQRQLEFDFVVAPGSDPRQIRLRVEGALSRTIEDTGDLVLGLGGGEVRLHKPQLYQERNGTRVAVAGAFALDGEDLGFDIGTYDLSVPLVIDPVLVYSTYLGGNRADLGMDIAVDAGGRAYVAGYTQSIDFPVSAGAYRGTPYTSPSTTDIFVARLEANGALSYATYLGGTARDEGFGVAIDTLGNAYVTGMTESTDFPTWPRPCGPAPFPPCPFQTMHGGLVDAFVTKLNASGSGLIFSTYLGGASRDRAYDIVVDPVNDVYVTGSVDNGGFHTTTGVFQPMPHAGCADWEVFCAGDAFVTKLNATGRSLAFSTYLGGDRTDLGAALAVDDTGNVYVTGLTYASNFPITPGALQATFVTSTCGESWPTNLPCPDAFVSKLNSTASALVYSTFLGGNLHDQGHAIEVHCTAFPRGNCLTHVVGETTSANFPTANAIQPTLQGPMDAFVSKLSATGGTLMYSTFFGGSSWDSAHGLDVYNGVAVVAGQTSSGDFPALHSMPVGAGDDAFVTRFTSTGGVFYSTRLGGSDSDVAHGVAVDASGHAYVTGSTGSINFPVRDALQPKRSGMFLSGTDAFIAKISPELQPSANAGPDEILLESAPGATPFMLNGTASDPDSDPLTFEWRDAAGVVVGTSLVVNLTRPPGVHLFTLNVFDNGGGVASDTVTVTIHRPPVANAGSDQVIEAVSGSTAPFTLNGTASSDPDGNPITYQWRDGANNLVGNTATVPLTRPLGSHTFSLIVSDSFGVLSQADTVMFTIRDTTAPFVAVTAPNGGDILFTSTPYQIEWSASDNGEISAFHVAYSVDGGANYAPVPGCTAISGAARSCTWAAPGPTTSAGRIRVSAQDLSGGAGLDASNANHSIVAGAGSVTLSQPNTRVNWGIGSTQQIKWAHNLGSDSRMRVEFSGDGGQSWNLLDPSFKNTGVKSSTFNWAIASAPTDLALVRVSWANGPTVSAMSAVMFDVSESFVVLAAPATTAARYGYGTARIQTWTTNLGPLDKVNVHLSVDGGSTFPVTLGTNIAAMSKKLSFVTPALSSPTSTARIRVQSTANALVQNLTPVNFQIGPPYVRVTNPNVSTHAWSVGTARAVTWASNLGTSESVRIELSLDDGQTFPIVLFASTPADGSQNVTALNGWATSSGRIRITWVRDALVTDVSDHSIVIK